MPTLTSPTTGEPTTITSPPVAAKSGLYWPAFGVFAFFIGFFCIWASLDHTAPTWDGAGHALRGYQCADILKAHICVSHKVMNLLTVNSFYPPFTYFCHGLLHTVLGGGEWVDALGRLFWYGLAGFSIYKTAALVLEDRATAALATAIFYLYPGTYGVSHAILLLDIPLTSMIFLSIWRMCVWRTQQTWGQAVVLGVVLGLACLTKQTAALFFAVPAILLVAQAIWRKQWASVAQLGLVGLLSGGLFLLWAVPNFTAFKEFVAQNQSVMHNEGPLALWSGNLWQYSYLATTALSPLGVIALLVGLPHLRVQKRLWLWVATACGALVLHTVLNWIPQFRYLLPAAGYTAILSAAGIMMLWRTEKFWYRAGIVVAGLYAMLVFLDLNLTPYPINLPPSFERQTGISWIRKSYPAGMKSEPISPTPPSDDWGYDWTFNFIDKTDGHSKSTLCVLPDLAELNTPGFMYYARVRESGVILTTYRLWSMAGYDFIDPPNLPWVRWFLLLQNSNQKAGREFCNEAAKQRYDKFVNMLKTDKTYALAARKNIPGGGELLLYMNTTRPAEPIVDTKGRR